jgi:uncharacterized repeat protein (TIGR03803 family)
VFKLDKDGTETALYSFPGGTMGENPYSGLIRDQSGNLYGQTCCGGLGAGVVFKLDGNGQESTFYTFTGGNDGGYPYYGLLQAGGKFYGTATGGGADGQGVVFRLNSNGNETPIYSFAGGADGAVPVGQLVHGAGAFYGVTANGGTTDNGTVFKVTSDGVENVLYSFNGGSSDGSSPVAGLVRDSAGNLYGTTNGGGATYCFIGCGIVFKIATDGTETILHSFSGHADGANPYGALVLDSSGNLYGTTFSGGNLYSGVVFKLDTSNNETLLYTFAGGTDGANPRGALLRTRAGDLYGTTVAGGGAGCGGYGCGVVFRITP